MLKQLAMNLTMVFAVGALAFGANEAYAASSAVNTPNCASNYNWCAPSKSGNGDVNCRDCCRENNSPDGLCISYAETTDQGCLCF